MAYWRIGVLEGSHSRSIPSLLLFRVSSFEFVFCGMATEIIVPKLGQTVETCKLLEWLVKKGDTIEKGEPIFSIETDKAAFDIEASASGIVKEMFFEAEAEVPVGMIIGVIGAADEDTSDYKPVIWQEPGSDNHEGQRAPQDEAEKKGFVLDMSMSEREEQEEKLQELPSQDFG